MQSKPVDSVLSIDERKSVTNEQLVRGISKEKTSVTFEFMKLCSCLHFEALSGCFS